MGDTLYFVNQVDCESTQPAVDDAALGRRATRGHAEVLESHGLKGTYFTIPSEVRANADVYKELADRGHEVGLHVHPADGGYEEFLGVYGPDDQTTIVGESTKAFEDVMGFQPVGICIGYGASNDATHGVLHAIGYRHGLTQIPGRILPECASVAAGAPLDPHYAHRYNRVLAGDLDFVETPQTVDPDSRMWGGKHPQDLRVELVDAKNHYYVIRKAIERQIAAETPLKVVHCVTHNTFEYDDADDFRRQTLVGIIEHTRKLADQFGLELAGATTAELAAAYRKVVPLDQSTSRLTLDRRGYDTKAT
jgi:peptidoglycan/xylan/chitin deacetylase (PgdA/CDA1 family)